MSPRYYFPSFSIGRAKSAEAEFVETHIEKAPMYSTCFFTLWPIEMSFTKAPSSVGAEEMSFCEQRIYKYCDGAFVHLLSQH